MNSGRRSTYSVMLHVDPFSYRLEAADRLDLILNRIGFALWQIQELESVAANYFVLLVQAQKGTGLEAGESSHREGEEENLRHYCTPACRGWIVSAAARTPA
jgi:hypothetical protein